MTNEIFQARCVDTGVLEADVAKQYGCTGPVARGSGSTTTSDGTIPTATTTDSSGTSSPSPPATTTRACSSGWANSRSRRRSSSSVSTYSRRPEGDREIQSNVPRTLKPDPDAELYRAVEGAKGELGIYVRADGTETPARFKIRSPSFSNLSVLPEIVRGEYLPDLIAAIGSLDCIMGEVDR